MSQAILANKVANTARCLIGSLFENREIAVYPNVFNPWSTTYDTHHASTLLYLVRALSMLREQSKGGRGGPASRSVVPMPCLVR